MTTADLIAGLLQSGVRLTAIGDQIEIDGPEELITKDLLDELAGRKAEIVDLLGSQCDNGDRDLRYDRTIVEIDLGSIAACPRCGSLEKWWNAFGEAHCLWCEPPTAAMNLLTRANEIRSRHATGMDRRRTAPTEPHCRRCFSTQFVDTKVHGGRSIRRDCAQCGLTAGFPMWFGKVDARFETR